MVLHKMDGNLLTLSPERTAMMGILNLTPDSFYDGGNYLIPAVALEHAQNMVAAGADLIDLGAESTRPMAEEISSQEEWHRLEKVLTLLMSSSLSTVLSIDTRHTETARMAGSLGVKLLNLPFPQEFFSELSLRNDAAEILAPFEGIILMHSRGTPKTMKTFAQYEGDIVETIVAELQNIASLFSQHFGLPTTRMIYDPGVGFAKNADQNLTILRRLPKLAEKLARPILVGASRKTFLGHITGLPVEQRLAPSLAAALWSAQHGAALLRVHDVKETRAALTLFEKLSHSDTA